MKCFSLIMLIAFIIICPLTADAYPAYELVMSSNIGDGEGTSDSIDDIPGFVVNGIRIYLGYNEGEYNPGLSISDCKALNNSSAPAQLALVASDDSGLENAVTIYVAADSNVSSESAVTLRFDYGSGWTRADGTAGDSVEIVSSVEPTDVTYSDSNVIARDDGNGYLMLLARRGAPKGTESMIVAYNELSWPNDGSFPAGEYTATVSVEVVTGV